MIAPTDRDATPSTNMAKITMVWGICGIGNGHTHRQLPLIDACLRAGARIAIFAYGASLAACQRRYGKDPLVVVCEVAVAYWPGHTTGLDFKRAGSLAAKEPNPTIINAEAFSQAERFVAVPDVVVSDYEPIAAQYAYAMRAPLVTVDQQSKYLTGQFPNEIRGYGSRDEVMRLSMFFPRAEKRLACSYFMGAGLAGSESSPVEIVAPVIRDSLRSKVTRKRSEQVVVYRTAQPGPQPIDEVLTILQSCSHTAFMVIAPENELHCSTPENVRMVGYGSTDFDDVLLSASGIISTAGHSLLSEAMYLETPVFALPLPLYEQQMNAAVIAENGFGMASTRLSRESLGQFLERLDTYRKAIANDSTALVRGDGKQRILEAIYETADVIQ